MNSVAQSTHLRIRSWNSIGRYLVGVGSLLRLAAELLAIPFPRERLLGPAFVTRFQVEGVLLDVLDDVFLLHFPLEPAESALDGFALLDFHFSHATNTPFAGGNWCKYARLSRQPADSRRNPRQRQRNNLGRGPPSCCRISRPNMVAL